MDNLKGWRTVLIGVTMAAAPAALTYLAGVDWTKLIGPNGAMAVAGVITIVMRIVTTTPVGSAK